MSAQVGTPAPDAGVGMHALEVATLYLFAALAVLALVALLLQELSIRGGAPSLREALVADSSGLTWVSHACLIGFLTAGTVLWNFGGLAQLRQRRHHSLNHPPSPSRPRSTPLPVLPEGLDPSPRGPPRRPARAYEPPLFAQRSLGTVARTSFLAAIRRSYPVTGA